MNIKQLPSLDRPREKALHYGIEKLSDYELLAILIGSGYKEDSALDIAYQMIRESNGLFHLVQKPISDLLNIKGIKKAKAVKIIAAFEIAKRYNSQQPLDQAEEINNTFIYKRYKPLLIKTEQECVYLVILDKKKHIVHEVNLYRGNERNVPFSKNQIIREVFIHNGLYFYIVHNHPSGSLFPSEEDIVFTTDLIKQCQKVGIILLDHLIISRDGYFTFQYSEIIEDKPLD